MDRRAAHIIAKVTNNNLKLLKGAIKKKYLFKEEKKKIEQTIRDLRAGKVPGYSKLEAEKTAKVLEKKLKQGSFDQMSEEVDPKVEARYEKKLANDIKREVEKGNIPPADLRKDKFFRSIKSHQRKLRQNNKFSLK